MGTTHMCACVLRLCSSMSNHHGTTCCSTSIDCSYQQAQLQTSSASAATSNHSYNQQCYQPAQLQTSSATNQNSYLPTLLPTSSATNQLSYQPAQLTDILATIKHCYKPAQLPSSSMLATIKPYYPAQLQTSSAIATIKSCYQPAQPPHRVGNLHNDH